MEYEYVIQWKKCNRAPALQVRHYLDLLKWNSNGITRLIRNEVLFPVVTRSKYLDFYLKWLKYSNTSAPGADWWKISAPGLKSDLFQPLGLASPKVLQTSSRPWSQQRNAWYGSTKYHIKRYHIISYHIKPYHCQHYEVNGTTLAGQILDKTLAEDHGSCWLIFDYGTPHRLLNIEKSSFFPKNVA